MVGTEVGSKPLRWWRWSVQENKTARFGVMFVS